jgi:uncharacterized Zn finger protein
VNEPDETGGRTFEALPPARGRGFARTWWGRAWIRALEDDALDPEQLRRGRGYARAGAVGAVSVRPGRVTAVVRDRDGTHRRCDVLVRELDGAGWDRLLDVVAGEAGHIAALLDRDLPPRLAEDADAAGVALLPGIGDLEPECDCGEWDHCPHTAALCYQLARLLDRDPLLLLLVRGRDERALLEEAQLRGAARAERAARTAGPGAAGARTPEGVPAEEAYALGAILPPLPDAPPAVDAPGGPVSLRGGTPPAPGVDAAALEFLAASAAAAGRGAGPGARRHARARTAHPRAGRGAAGRLPARPGRRRAAGRGVRPYAAGDGGGRTRLGDGRPGGTGRAGGGVGAVPRDVGTRPRADRRRLGGVPGGRWGGGAAAAARHGQPVDGGRRGRPAAPRA